jgi:hypothetical protein
VIARLSAQLLSAQLLCGPPCAMRDALDAEARNVVRYLGIGVAASS